MRTFFNLSLLLAIFLVVPVAKIVASGEFAADYDVQYAVSPAGKTIVTQNVALTNRLSNLYPKRYTIVIDSEKIDSIIAYDGKGEIKTVITQKDGKTEIVLPFNERAVGLGKVLRFTLRYESRDIAVKNGAIWEINIPPIMEDADILTYDVSLEVPASFGQNAYLSPQPGADRRWNKEQMIGGGISAAYGQEQYFSVKLAYHLENPTGSAVDTDIAIPPDTAYQKVSIGSLVPAAKRVTRDKDGNWLARYSLGAGESLDVRAVLTLSVFLTPRVDYGKEHLAPDDYIAPDTYWETGDPEIKALGSRLTSPREIFDYVGGTLSYDYNRVNQNPARKGAVSALGSPKNSICTDFTDLFIAIARAAGIPSREVVGYAYTTNPKLRPLSLVSDILHAWPEYFDRDRDTWVPVDPTWAKTTGGVNYFDKLDFNHIVFAIHGTDSEFPYPAGFYRKAGTPGKVVDVQFAQAETRHAEGKLSSDITFPGLVATGMDTNGMLRVKNTSGVGIDDIAVNVVSIPAGINFESTIEHVPPLTDVTVPIRYKPASIFATGNGRLLVTVNGELTNVTFTLVPLPAVVAIGAIFPILIVGGFVLWSTRRKR